MKAKDSLEDGPSHLQVSIVVDATKLHRFKALSPEKVHIARMNVGAIRTPVRDWDVRLVCLPDAYFEEFADAHAVLTGYQVMRPCEIRQYQRYLARMAVSIVNDERARMPAEAPPPAE
jgi:hypothetical protein